MGDALTVSGQKQAYTLNDEAKFLTYKKNYNLQLFPIINEGETLLNRHTIMTINPQKFPKTNVNAATNFTNWLIPAEVRSLSVTKAKKPTANLCSLR